MRPPTPVTAEGKWGPRAGGLGPPATTVISCSWFCSPVTMVFMCLTSTTFKVSRLKTWVLLTPQITLAGRSLWSEILFSFNHSTSECYTFYTNTRDEWIKQKHNTRARLRGSGAFIIKLECYPFGWHACIKRPQELGPSLKCWRGQTRKTFAPFPGGGGVQSPSRVCLSATAWTSRQTLTSFINLVFQ